MKNKQRGTRHLAWMLCAALAVALLPMAALAEDATPDGPAWAPEQAKVGETVTFTAPDEAGATDTTAWTWDFGDGSGTQTGQSLTHAYVAAGTYQVTLTGRNAENLVVYYHEEQITVTKYQPTIVTVGEIVYHFGDAERPEIKIQPTGIQPDGSASVTAEIPEMNISPGYFSIGNMNSLTLKPQTDFLDGKPAGRYKIIGKIEGNAQNEGFSGEIGVLVLEKRTPLAVFAAETNQIRYEAGNCEGNKTVTVEGGAISGYVGEGQIEAKLVCNGTALWHQQGLEAEANVDTGTELTLGDTDALNAIEPGTYELFYESSESAHNNAVRAKAGTVTFTGVKSMKLTPAAPRVERGGRQEIELEMETVGREINSEVDWTLTGASSAETKIERRGTGVTVQVGADEKAETLTVSATSQHSNGVQGRVSGQAVLQVEQGRAAATTGQNPQTGDQGPGGGPLMLAALSLGGGLAARRRLKGNARKENA